MPGFPSAIHAFALTHSRRIAFQRYPRLISVSLGDRIPEHPIVASRGFKYHVTEMVCWAAGGPQTYTGRSMRDSHRHLNITPKEWDGFHGCCSPPAVAQLLLVRPSMKASMIDGVLTTAAGIYLCLIAFGVVRLSKDQAKEEEWRKKWGGLIKFAGPLLGIWGLFSVLRGL